MSLLREQANCEPGKDDGNKNPRRRRESNADDDSDYWRQRGCGLLVFGRS